MTRVGTPESDHIRPEEPGITVVVRSPSAKNRPRRTFYVSSALFSDEA